MNRKWCLPLICTICLFSLTGCWNRRELNELGIVTMIGIDKAGKQYRVSMQIINPAEIATKAGGGNRAPATMYQETGETIFQALRKMSTVAPRRLYFSHLQMLILGDKLAKSGIKEALDYLSRDHELRTDFFITVAKDEMASDILKIVLPVEKLPSQHLFEKLEVSDKVWAATGTIKLDELMADLMSKGKEPVITGLKIEGNPETGSTPKNIQGILPVTRLKYNQMAAFRNDKLVGWLTTNESKGFNWTQNGHTHSTIVDVLCPKGGKSSVEVIRAKTKTKGKIVNGNPQFDVNIQVEGNLAEVQCDIDVTKPATLKEIEKKAEQNIQSKVESAIKKAKTLKTDIFGFGEEIHRSDPKAWKQLEKNWDEKEFIKAKVNVQANVKIRRVGTVNNSFIKGMGQ